MFQYPFINQITITQDLQVLLTKYSLSEGLPKGIESKAYFVGISGSDLKTAKNELSKREIPINIHD